MDEEDRAKVARSQEIFGTIGGVRSGRVNDVKIAVVSILHELMEKEFSVAEIAIIGGLLADPSGWHIVVQPKVE